MGNEIFGKLYYVYTSIVNFLKSLQTRKALAKM
jgi:hypothetical protein